MRDICFVHIPKTAGTALGQAIRSALNTQKAGAIELTDYGPTSDGTSETIKKFIYGKADEDPLYFSDFRQANRLKRVFIRGHYPANKYWRFFHPASFVSVMREPFERTVSDYNHYLNHHGYEGDFQTFVNSFDIKNKQANYFKGVPLDNFGFIGIQEHMDQTARRLSAYLGLTISLPTSNVGQYTGKTLGLIESQEMRRYYESECADDCELYEKVATETAIFQPTSSVGVDQKVSIQHVNIHNDTYVSGWVKYNTEANTFPEIILVDKNGRKLQSRRPDIYRKDVQGKNGMTNPVAGFRFSGEHLQEIGYDNMQIICGKSRKDIRNGNDEG